MLNILCSIKISFRLSWTLSYDR